MESLTRPARIFRFGQFEADPARTTLTRNGVRVKIQEQPFRVLILLAEGSGEIVTRETLRQELWPAGTHVDFDGSLNVIMKKLRAVLGDDPDNPRFIETVPRHGYRFIAPVSSTEIPTPGGKTAATSISGAQFESTESSRPAEPPLESTPAPAAVKAGGSAKVIYASAAVFLLVVAAAWILRGRLAALVGKPNLANTAQAAPFPIRKSVAVLGFHNVSGKPSDAWLSTGLSEMLSTELAGGEKLRLVSGEDVANLRITAPWSQTDTLNQETTARIGNALNSEYLILGAYTTTGASGHEQIRLDVRLQDAKQGEILAEIAEVGNSQDLFRLVSRIGARLRERMGIPGLAETDQASVLASMPADADAARLYALGIEKLRQFDALAAKNLLEQATEADRKFPLAHAMLARAWSQLGYEQKRKEEAKKALDQSENLPRAEQLLVEGDYYESLANHEKAASVYYALFELYPDNVDYGLQLAGAQSIGSHASQARETLAELRRLPPPAGDDPRIDLVEARTTLNLPAKLALVRSATSKASLEGKKLIVAQARKEECMIQAYGEQPDQAIQACEDAYNTYIAAGNNAAAADSLRLMADSYGSHGRAQQSLATYERALEMLKTLGEHEKTGAVMNNMAIHFENEGKLDRAAELYREAMKNFVEAGDKANQLIALSNIADIHYARGDLSQAERLYGQGLELDSSLDLSDPSYLLYRRADLYLAQGKLQPAREGAQRAIDLIRPRKADYRNLTTAMMVLAEVEEAGGDLTGARKQFEEALELRQKLNESDLVHDTNAALAELAVREGHPEKAEPLLLPAIAEFEKEKSDPSAASACVTLSSAMLAQGKAEEAEAAVQRAAKFGTATPDPAVRLPIAIQRARVAVARVAQKGSETVLAGARQELRSTIATAKNLGYYRIELDARVALAELEMKANPQYGRAQLEGLVALARGRGLELIARQSEQLIASAKAAVAANKSGN